MGGLLVKNLIAFFIVLSWFFYSSFSENINSGVVPVLFLILMIGRNYIPKFGIVLRVLSGFMVLTYSILILLYFFQNNLSSYEALVGLLAGLVGSFYLSWFYATWDPLKKTKNKKKTPAV